MAELLSMGVETPPATEQPVDLGEAEEFSLALKKKKKKKAVKAEKTEPEEGAAPSDASSSSSEASSSAAEGSSSPSGEVSSSFSSLSLSDNVDYNYTELLDRVFSLLRDKNPNLTVRKRHTMPPPQLVRVGTRKTMWANFSQICQVMHRSMEHVQQFLLAELGTEGSIDANQRLVIKGRYQSKQIESLLKKYIIEYVTCSMCRNPDTSLTRDSVTRLYFIQCESCGSRRSVAPIKSGFHATMRTDRKKQKDM